MSLLFMQRLCFLVLLVVAGSLPLYAQQSLPPEARQLLDSALVRLHMSGADLWMPWDAYPDDAHRLPLVKELFGTPLHTFDVNRNFAEQLRISPAALYSEILPTLNLGPYIPYKLGNSLLTGELDSLLGLRVEKRFDMVTASILRQYLGPLVKAREHIIRARAGMSAAALELLRSHADSLLMYSAESPNRTVFEMKEDERREFVRSSELFARAEEVRTIAALYSYGFALYEEMRTLMRASLDVSDLYREKLTTTIVETQLGRIAIGGPGDDVFTGEFLFIFDAGGNDRYLIPERSKDAAWEQAVNCIIDLGGNDIYTARNYALGAGYFGAGIVIDNEGDDHYIAQDFSLGAGLFGVGIVEDNAGNDTYAGSVFSLGAGAFGVGMLIDRNGNDVYRGSANTQGFGFTRGCGILADMSGNDSYITSSPFQDFLRYEAHFVAFSQGAGLGYRPIASGGIGMLFDYKGNDTYSSDIFGQATAYWYAIGGLYDEEGDDRYIAYQYAQGSGVHLAHAVLIDGAGNDHYYSHGVSQGCGHDIAFGGLVDIAGDDDYAAESLSMGGGNANALSLLLDLSGNDSYSARTRYNMMGYSDWRRDYGMIGMFIDGGGRDLYSDTAGNNRTSTKSTYGVFLDGEYNTPQQTQSTEPALTPPAEERIPLARGLDSLFTQASAAPQKFQYNVQPARTVIIQKGDSAMPFLASRFGTHSARERHALRAIIPDMYRNSTGATAGYLADSLRSGDESAVLMVMELCGRCAAPECLPGLAQLLGAPVWRVRAAAARAIGSIARAQYADTLAPLLHDTHPHVRMRAAHAIGRLSTPNMVEYADIIFADSSQLVRNSFIAGVAMADSGLSMNMFLDLNAQAPTTALRVALAQLLVKVRGNNEAERAYKTYIRAQPTSVRRAVYESIAESESAFWQQTADKNRSAERDHNLRNIIPGATR